MSCFVLGTLNSQVVELNFTLCLANDAVDFVLFLIRACCGNIGEFFGSTFDGRNLVDQRTLIGTLFEKGSITFFWLILVAEWRLTCETYSLPFPGTRSQCAAKQLA